MIGTPAADALMRLFATPESVGVWQTFVVLGVVYTLAIFAGAFSYRLPAPGWRPAGWNPPAASARRQASVTVAFAWRTRQFWLLWAVLCLNVSAGIGVLGMASPMIQEIFKGRVNASAAAGFAGLLSLFNIGGRIFWASLSDVIGRRATYATFFALGAVLYAAVPASGKAGNVGVFVALFAVILTMYGGGFATIPAYLADLFGADNVSAIHGRLLTAWSTAGILGPVLVNYIREYQLGRGVPSAVAYDVTLYLLAGLLVVGFVCNWLVRPLPDAAFTGEAVAPAHERPAPTTAPLLDRGPESAGTARPGGWAVVAVAWTLVLVPLAWGTYRTLALGVQLFR